MYRDVFMTIYLLIFHSACNCTLNLQLKVIYFVFYFSSLLLLLLLLCLLLLLYGTSATSVVTTCFLLQLFTIIWTFFLLFLLF